MTRDRSPTQPQGRFLGLPYDWRRPTLAKARARLWQPGGPVLVPKVFGWGYAPNLAHPLWVCLAVGSLVTLGLAALLGV